jgi:hypothetical protein
MQTPVIDGPISKEAQDVLDMLDRWDERLQGHLNKKRDKQRLKFRSRVTISPADGILHDSAETTSQSNCIDAIARNLSQAGIALISHKEIKERNVTICLNPATDGSHLLHGEIMRIRQVHNNFWEYGVRFIENATNEEATQA